MSHQLLAIPPPKSLWNPHSSLSIPSHSSSPTITLPSRAAAAPGPSVTPSPVPLLLEWPPRTSTGLATGRSLLLPPFIFSGSHPSGPSPLLSLPSQRWERVLICFSYYGWEGVKSVPLIYITAPPDPVSRSERFWMNLSLLQACLPPLRWLDRKGMGQGYL